MKVTLDKGYEPGEIEERVLASWLERGLFHAPEKSRRAPYSIVIPPPNVTGSLHMGHALNNTLQDVLVRWRHMKGDDVLWMVGTDHAGIATQNVVEKELARQGVARADLGREEFVRRVWEWRREYGGRIVHQLQRLGCACDWERERFTMDEGLSRAVREVFVRLYEEGLIYRGHYIINWCPRCHTALSDLEVDYEDLAGKLWYVRYPLEGGGFIEVATTRPETILGDTAVAFNPADRRYRRFADGNARAVLPVLGRVIPVVPDEFVSPEFGTGAVKITPAHDPNDYEVSLRHGLPAVRAIAEDGTMTEEAGPYAGMDRYECRRRIVEDLERKGLLVKVEDHHHAVGHCYRCRTVIEPYLSRQWFVRTKPLAEPAIRAVETGDIRIVPAQWEKTYFEWMNNIRDWCISRQIWWGHRIPAWYCDECGEVTVSREDVTVCGSCRSASVRQESDVLDTWFSSALWPFSTMGWPDRTDLLESYYPTSVLVTGFDILFFWVARMIMMGLKFMGEKPFGDVYIHALVRDAEGQKMSKSRGNVIDPLEIIDRYGTDALRFTLVAFAAQGRDIKLSEERIEGYRHFANKIWNASRFVLMNLGKEAGARPPAAGGGELADRWILSRLAAVAGEVEDAFRGYLFNEAAGAVYRFIWHELCDWYLELAKMRLYGDDQAKGDRARELLIFVLDQSLRLLHPFMPFITEEIWSRLPGTGGSLIEAAFPDREALSAFRDEKAENEMAVLMDAVSAVRNIRGEMNVPPSARVKAVLRPVDAESLAVLEANVGYVSHLAGADEPVAGLEAGRPAGSAAAVTPSVEVFVALGGLLDLQGERDRLRKGLERLDKDREASERKLANPKFVERAPAEVVNEERRRLEDLARRRARLQENLEAVEEAMS